jgi:nitroreductase
MDVLEAMRTTRSMRRLDPGRDVSDVDLETMIDAATRAATGGNAQPVRWLVVRDPEVGRGTPPPTQRGHVLGRLGPDTPERR